MLFEPWIPTARNASATLLQIVGKAAAGTVSGIFDGEYVFGQHWRSMLAPFGAASSGRQLRHDEQA